MTSVLSRLNKKLSLVLTAGAAIGLAAMLLAVGACLPTTPMPTRSPSPTPVVSPTPKPSPPPSPPGQTYPLPELTYRLLASYEDYFWCDPDFFPVGRPGQEEKNAQDQFPIIKANAAEFAAILTHTGMPSKADYTPEEKLSIYREHKKLTYPVQVNASRVPYQFALRVGQGQGFRIEGTIAPSGEITVTKRESSFNTCPICLAKGTLIDTPDGTVPVETLRPGMPVWTQDEAGQRTVAMVIKVSATPVPPSFEIVRVRLGDGRTVTASPGHPTAGKRPLGEYQEGDTMNGARVVAIERLPYSGATYDLLPSGATGLYWADGVLLASTLAN